MIEHLFIASHAGSAQQSVDSIELIAGKGIVGDRNFGLSKWPGQNITFIEREQIEAFNRNYQQNIAITDTRRNVITSGVNLNDLVDKTFRIGDATFYGVELCEPCSDLGQALQSDGLSKAEVVKAFSHRGGLRADIIRSGSISIGMEISC